MPSLVLDKLGEGICGESGTVWRDAEMNSSVSLTQKINEARARSHHLWDATSFYYLSYMAGTVLSTLPMGLHLVNILWADHAICQAFLLESISQCFFCSIFIEGGQALQQHFHVFVEVAPS